MKNKIIKKSDKLYHSSFKISNNFKNPFNLGAFLFGQKSFISSETNFDRNLSHFSKFLTCPLSSN